MERWEMNIKSGGMIPIEYLGPFGSCVRAQSMVSSGSLFDWYASKVLSCCASWLWFTIVFGPAVLLLSSTLVQGDMLLLSRPGRQVSGILVQQYDDRIVFDVRDRENKVSRQEFLPADIRKLIRTIDQSILGDIENRSAEDLFTFAENLVSLSADHEAYFQSQRVLDLLLKRSNLAVEFTEAVERLKLVSLRPGLERSRLLSQWIVAGKSLPNAQLIGDSAAWATGLISDSKRKQLLGVLRSSRAMENQGQYVQKALVSLRATATQDDSLVELCDQVDQWCETDSVETRVRLLRLEILSGRSSDFGSLPDVRLPVDRMWPNR